MTPERPAPGGSEVIVWLLDSDLAAPCAGRLRQLLSPAELERAAGYARVSSSLLFIVNRGFLRLLLGRALRVPPADLVFTLEANGKPILAEPESPLAFNLSHTDRLAAFALSPGKRVGIDIETVREPADLGSIASYVFPAAVAARLAALPAEKRLTRFFTLWTRLEAVAKASGKGLGALPELKAAELDGDAPLAVEAGGCDYSVIDLKLNEIHPAADNHLAALCLEGDECRASLYRADGSLLHSWLDAWVI
ncbi:MAG: 4'-phosphopantetheinyl transferase superfamily protein [Spirochaetales bacterium]|nr:4'-phosphopantetheinyl transferase superfamily protein [Spirochaetales bacterium]